MSPPPSCAFFIPYTFVKFRSKSVGPRLPNGTSPGARCVHRGSVLACWVVLGFSSSSSLDRLPYKYPVLVQRMASSSAPPTPPS